MVGREREGEGERKGGREKRLLGEKQAKTIKIKRGRGGGDREAVGGEGGRGGGPLGEILSQLLF